MIKNYFKIAIRNLIRKKLFSGINIFGLSIGMAVSIIILLYVFNELTYDKFNTNIGKIYRVVLERKAQDRMLIDAVTPPPLGQALKNDFPEIKCFARFLNIDNPVPLINSGKNRFYEKQFIFTDPHIFNIFSFTFIAGEPETALNSANTVVITKEMAEKYFGTENALGQTINLNNNIDLKITGIIEKLPQNSTVKFDFLASFSTLEGWLGGSFLNSWQNNMCQTYILLKENISAENINFDFNAFKNKYLDKTTNIKNVILQPMSRIHLYSFRDYSIYSGGDIQYIYLLIALSVFIILLACFNYINLTTSQYLNRSKEVGIRKTIGAEKKHLIMQFLGEAITITFIAFLVSILLVQISIPYLPSFLGNISSSSLLKNGSFIAVIIGIVFFVGLLSGLYPAVILSSFRPGYSLRGGAKLQPSKITFRKILVVGQFVITITLLISTLIVNNQVEYLQNKKLGFDGNKVIVVPIRQQNLRENIEPIKNKIKQYSGVNEVGGAALLPGGPVGKTRFRAEGQSESNNISMLWVDIDFIPTLNIEMMAGRNFSKNYLKDSVESFIVNEEAVKQLNWKPAEAIGKTFELTGGKKGYIIGVVKDFHFASLQRQIEPVVLYIWPWMNYILIRTNTEKVNDVVINLKKDWAEFDQENPFDYTILNTNFDRFYKSEKQFGSISKYSSILSIIIACFGLFGLISLSVEQKNREIGIRKVLGSSVYKILILLTKDMLKLLLFANILAWPIAYYFMGNWLQNFAYRIDITVWYFISCTAIVFIVALFTMCLRIVKAALANPVKSLKYE